MTNKSDVKNNWMYDENIGASYERIFDPVERYYKKRGELAVINGKLQPSETASTECIEYYDKHLRKFYFPELDEDGYYIQY